MEVTQENRNYAKIDPFEMEAIQLIERFKKSFADPMKANVEHFASNQITFDQFVVALDQYSKKIHDWHKDVRSNLLISDKETKEMKQMMRRIKENIYTLGYSVESATKMFKLDPSFYKNYYATKDSAKDGTGPIEDIQLQLSTIHQNFSDYKELRKKYPALDVNVQANSKNVMPEHMPDDFKFIVKYGVGAKNILNTFDDSFTKDMVVDPPITIRLKLSEEEKKTVYHIMRLINIWDYPTHFDPETMGMETPHSSYYLKIQMNGKTKEIYWTQAGTSEEDEAVKLRELIHWYIRDEIVHSRPEYQKLPDPRGGYM